MGKHMERLLFILLLFMSPIAFLALILKALFSLLQFLWKATLLFSIVAIHTPFAVMANSSALALTFLDPTFYKFDPRLDMGFELQAIVSDFFKIVAAELLVVVSAGVITFYTAPTKAFYISMSVGVTTLVLKWLNTRSLSKTAFSYICEAFGLNPMMFFFSFIELFDIGCHPIAKCSFRAHKAFVLKKEIPSEGNEWKKFEEKIISEDPTIEFSEWNPFERGLFQLSPRIDFIKTYYGKYELKSFMVLKLFGRNLCKYPVERLELPEDYFKVNELYNFLVTLSSADGFVTDKMRGRYQHSSTLLEIVDGVLENAGYKIEDPKAHEFVVAGYTD